MPGLGLSEAARLVGKDVSTLHRAMAKGRLSFAVDSAGKRILDPAELERVYGIKQRQNGKSPVNGDAGDAFNADAGQRIAAQSPKAPESNAFTDALQATIADLRTRLDASEAERRRLSERLTGLLTHRQAGSVPAVPAARVPWWRKWFR